MTGIDIDADGTAGPLQGGNQLCLSGLERRHTGRLDWSWLSSP